MSEELLSEQTLKQLRAREGELRVQLNSVRRSWDRVRKEADALDKKLRGVRTHKDEQRNW